MSESNDQNGNGGTALTTSEQPGIENIRRAGAVAVAERKALREMYVMLEGCEWGSGNSVVRGSGFSDSARAALAKLCVVTRANPQIHIDILGGKPYHNAQYFRDRVSPDPYFIDDVQRNISPGIIVQLREQAQQALDEAKRMGLPEPTQEVQDLLADARMIARLHSEYAVPAWATIAYETIIRRYTENAPLDKIRNGEVADPSVFIRTVRECNWAGNKPERKKSGGGTYDPDPIGNMDPEKTARTRSFRRCARNAFSVWFDKFDDSIQRAYEMVEAEWEEVKDRPLPPGNAIATGDGEPTSTRAALPERLPVSDITSADEREPEPVEARTTQATTPAREATTAAAPAEPAAEEQPNGEFTEADRQELRKRLFPDLLENGIKGEPARKAWATENELPESTKTWTRRDFDDAFRILEGPAREELLEAVGAHGFESVDEFCTARSLELPVTLKDVKALSRIVRASS